MRERDKPDGWNLVERASGILQQLNGDLFSLPGAAQDRAIAERERLGEEHGDDLLCGCWAAAEEATALLELMGRHIDGLVHLTNIHPGHAPTGQTLARAIVEHGLRIQWLLQPKEAAERESRWLALKAEELRLYEFLPGISEESVEHLRIRIAAVEDFTGLERPAGTPSVESLAKEFTPRGRLYTLYRLMSQTTHGTAVGAGSFHVENRFDWHAQGGEGEWIESEFWSPALLGAWEAASGAARRYRDLLCPDQSIPSLQHDDEYYRTVYSIPPNYQAREAVSDKLGTQKRVGPRPMNRAQRRAAAKEARRRRRR